MPRACCSPVQRRFPFNGGGGVGVATVGQQHLAQVFSTASDRKVQRGFPALSLGVRISSVPQQLQAGVRHRGRGVGGGVSCLQRHLYRGVTSKRCV